MISNRVVDNALKVFLGGFDVHGDGLLLDVWVTHNDHDVGRAGELINEGGKFLVFDHH